MIVERRGWPTVSDPAAVAVELGCTVRVVTAVAVANFRLLHAHGRALWGRDEQLLDALVESISVNGPGTLVEIAAQLGRTTAEVGTLVLHGTQHGVFDFDLERDFGLETPITIGRDPEVDLARLRGDGHLGWARR